MAREERERIIEEKLLAALRKRAASVPIHQSSIPSVASFQDLLKGRGYKHFHNDSDWNPYKKLMPDIIGNMCPDIVLRSEATHENRIYIEVKDTNRLADGHYDIEDSQVVRYFIHLLGTTLKNPTDIGRAMLLCAPSRWFADRHNAKAWGHFVEHFSGLATKFDITIGQVHADDLDTAGETDVTDPSLTEYLCPCGSGKLFNVCHRHREKLLAAIHEIGHAASLPVNSMPHVSFLDPCRDCQNEGKSKPSSAAHTGYGQNVDFTSYGLLLYALAGGASEIACGVQPTMKRFDVGEYPASMEQDFADLKADFESRGISWEAAKENIKFCFPIIVAHMRKHVGKIRELALASIDRQSLTAGQMDFTFLERDQLLVEMEAD